jgi:hypothetical protein
MINYHKEVVSALSAILPTHYEMALTSKTKTPCYSYQEANNYDTATGDTLGYSTISYTIKTWANDIGTIQRYAAEADKVMKQLGFKRTATGELYDNASTMIQKITTYEALALEDINGGK